MDQVTWFRTKLGQVTWICKIVDQITWPFVLHRARLPGTSNLRVRLPGFAKPWTRLPGKRNVRTRLPRPQFCKGGPGYLVDQITWSRPKVGQIAWSRPVGPREMAFATLVLARFRTLQGRAISARAQEGSDSCRLDRPSSGAGVRMMKTVTVALPQHVCHCQSGGSTIQQTRTARHTRYSTRRNVMPLFTPHVAPWGGLHNRGVVRCLHPSARTAALPAAALLSAALARHGLP